jgi:hypothetical protein
MSGFVTLGDFKRRSRATCFGNVSRRFACVWPVSQIVAHTRSARTDMKSRMTSTYLFGGFVALRPVGRQKKKRKRVWACESCLTFLRTFEPHKPTRNPENPTCLNQGCPKKFAYEMAARVYSTKQTSMHSCSMLARFCNSTRLDTNFKGWNASGSEITHRAFFKSFRVPCLRKQRRNLVSFRRQASESERTFYNLSLSLSLSLFSSRADTGE